MRGCQRCRSLLYNVEPGLAHEQAELWQPPSVLAQLTSGVMHDTRHACACCLSVDNSCGSLCSCISLELTVLHATGAGA